MIGLNAVAQQTIQLKSTDKSRCVKSDMTSLRATFSFSKLDAEAYKSKNGEFSELSMPNTVMGGNEGDPAIPVVNELIAVPVGATPRIEVKSFKVTDYNLDDYDIKTIVPRQPSLRKDKNPDDVPFVYNKASYQKGGLNKSPNAVVKVVGTMRGVRLAKMTVEPVSYDPVNNSLRVFNDIEVEVHFDGANAKATQDMYTETYSPYFDIVYKQLFNGSAAKSAYTDHPDLYTTPVKMLVITTQTFANSTPFQNWVTWKKQKGIDVDVQVVANNASAATIKSTIYSRYNATHPTFLVLVGDESVVTCYSLWNYGSTYGNAANDLEYASVDGDVYHDMFMSRMPVSTTTQLGNLVNKILTYEKYTMSDPSYLDNVLLIAGDDYNWAPKVGRPTINYAANSYFNTAHGFTNVYKYVTDTYTGCYNHLSTGVGFGNYTAHGDIEMLADPQFTNTDADALTNNDKYFWFIGNCCLTANFKNAQNNMTCLGETLVRAANKGAFGYIGSVPESYWYEDYYFGVGATTTFNSTPAMSATTTGIYDAMFDDTGFNTLNSVPFIGNVAVSYAHAGSYDSSVSDEYYWRAYQCFGDGSVMPYLTQPAANNVNHDNTIFIGAPTFTVSADAGSYVSITKDNEILGVAVVPSTGSVDVPITPITSGGDVMIVVTRQQRQPYIQTIQAIAPEGPYLSLDSYMPNITYVGVNTGLSLTFKNVGVEATTGTTNVTLTAVNTTDVTILSGTGSFDALAPDATATVTGLSFRLNPGIDLDSKALLHYVAQNGDKTWEGNIFITPNQNFTVTVASNNNDFGTVSGGGDFDYKTPCTVTATPADGYMFTSWTVNGAIVSTDAEYTFNVTDDTNLVANFTLGVMIGSGTATSDFLPSYNYYKYSLTEQIYTPAELGGAGLITSIAFYNGGATKTRTLDFYMKATTKNSFSSASDWIAVTAADKVFSGTVTMTANDWTTITFSTPFLYDGNSNVVLVTDDNTGEYTSSPHMSCRVFNTTGNQALYVYNDNTNLNPASTSTSGTLLNMKNQLIVTKAAVDGSYSITVSADPSYAGTVTGGGEYSFGDICTVTATPNPGYYFSGWTEYGKVVSKDLTYNFSVFENRSLVATFKEGIIVGEGSTETNTHIPSYSYYKYSLTEQIYTPSEIGTSGLITAIGFYNGGAEKTRTFDLYLVHTEKGEFSSKTDWITASADDKAFSGDVTMLVGDWTFITLDKPFYYNGRNNLAVIIDDNTASSSAQPHMACRVYGTASNQALYAHSSKTDYDPSVAPASQSTNNNVLNKKSQLFFNIITPGTLELANDGTANVTAISEAAATGRLYDVTLSGRTLWKDGDWNTLCLPFDMTAQQVSAQLNPTELMSLDSSASSLNNGTLSLNFTNETTISAGVPYIIRWDSGDNLVNPVFYGVTINDATPNSKAASFIGGSGEFIGNYNSITFEAGDQSILFLGAANTLYWPNADINFGAFRAYFQLGGSKQVRAFNLKFGEDGGQATGIISVENGKLVIDNEEGWYTVDGRKLPNAPKRKGLYIHNGVKVVIK